MIKLNLGCGEDIRREPGVDWINCDINPECAGKKPDKIVDLEKPLPFESGTIDYVYTNQVFEHIRNYTELMIEIHRVLKMGGILEASVPLFPCRAAVADPDHIRFFVAESFTMFENPEYHPYFRGAGLFEVIKTEHRFNKYPNISVEESKAFFTELKVKLKKVVWAKDGNGKWSIS